MPKYSKEHEKEFIAKIHQVLVYNPNASILTIQKFLSANGTALDKDYINRLLKKIRGERANRYSHQMEKMVVAKIEDLTNYLNTKLLKIEQSTSNDMVKIMAIRQINIQILNLFKIQRDAGVFKEAEEKEDDLPNTVEILRIIDNAEKERAKANIKQLDIIENRPYNENNRTHLGFQ